MTELEIFTNDKLTHIYIYEIGMFSHGLLDWLKK